MHAHCLVFGVQHRFMIRGGQQQTCHWEYSDHVRVKFLTNLNHVIQRARDISSRSAPDAGLVITLTPSLACCPAKPMSCARHLATYLRDERYQLPMVRSALPDSVDTRRPHFGGRITSTAAPPGSATKAHNGQACPRTSKQASKQEVMHVGNSCQSKPTQESSAKTKESGGEGMGEMGEGVIEERVFGCCSSSNIMRCDGALR